MQQDISIEEALQLTNAYFVDLRSEGEYQEDTIPGAINIPIFNNEERAQIGITYKQVSVEKAKELGLKFIAPKLADIYNQLRMLSQQKKVIIFCWRGGMRSQFVLNAFSSLSLPLQRISGGYRSYRRYVHAYLSQEELPQRAIVLHGLTGVGKTDVLKKLTKMGVPVLDLEGLALHRGSVYGKIGLPPSPSQKYFESLIFSQFKKYEKNKYFLVECESRRIGQLLVPPPVMKAIKAGNKILLYAQISDRVARIKKEYTKGADFNTEALKVSTSFLTRRLGKNKVAELNQLLEQHQFEEVFTYLLTEYYDPLYKYPQQDDVGYELCVDCSDIDQAAEQIYQYLEKLTQ